MFEFITSQNIIEKAILTFVETKIHLLLLRVLKTLTFVIKCEKRMHFKYFRSLFECHSKEMFCNFNPNCIQFACPWCKQFN